MKIKVEEKPVSRDYPYIGAAKNGVIVLFFSKGTGICLSTDDNEDNVDGEYHKNWAEETFSFFEGTITLSND